MDGINFLYKLMHYRYKQLKNYELMLTLRQGNPQIFLLFLEC